MEVDFVDHIGIFENCATQEYCELAIQYYERNSVNAKTRQELENIESLKKNTTTLFFDQLMEPNNLSEADKKFTNDTLEIMNKCYDAYVAKYSIITEEYASHGIDQMFAKIQKTNPSEGYHMWHCEVNKPDNMHRMMLFILYLNDVDEGGETEFLYQHKRINAKMGRGVICPAYYTHTHRGNPPLSGSKYILNTWICFDN